jgi:hypothetical protein
LKGSFVKGYCEGENCLFAFSTGAYYKGSTRENKFEGTGKFIDDSHEYFGRWKNNLPHGEGV